MSDAQAFLGAGDLYIQRQDPTTLVWGPLHGPFDAEKFAYKPNSEKLEKTSKGKTTYGQVRATVFKPSAPEFSVTLGQANRENLPLALMGVAADINTAGGTLTAEDVTVTNVGGWIEMPWANISATGLTITSADTLTTYVRDTDYIINIEMGWLKILSGSGILLNDVLKLTGTHGAITGTKINAGTVNQLRARFILDGKNLVDGSPVKATAKQVAMSSDTEFDLLGDNFAEIPLTGSVETPVGHSTGFEVELLTLA
jgi:hypothetical protein